MKISELIEKLEKNKNVFGDLEVMTRSTPNGQFEDPVDEPISGMHPNVKESKLILENF